MTTLATKTIVDANRAALSTAVGTEMRRVVGNLRAAGHLDDAAIVDVVHRWCDAHTSASGTAPLNLDTPVIPTTTRRRRQ